MALKLSDGFVLLVSEGMPDNELTEKYVCPVCEISLPDIEPRLFSFNAPAGACPDCGGLGFHMHFSPELAVNPELPLAKGGFIPWKSMKHMIQKAEKLAEKKGWDISRPFGELPSEAQEAMLYGSDEVLPLVFTDRSGDWEIQRQVYGAHPVDRKALQTLDRVLKKSFDRYRVEDVCAACKGARLKPEALAVTLGGYNIRQAHGDARRRAYKGARRP